MSTFLTDIKQITAKFIFNQKLNKLKRQKKLVNLNEAKTIGIIYNVTDQEIFKKIKYLIKDLTTRNRQVMALGFINLKSIPNYCVAPNSGYFFNRNDLNWYGIPKNDYITKFINKELDILIDLTMDDVFVLKYISGLSKSKLKVGRYSEEYQNYYDLMINADKIKSIDTYIEQILHYLLILKSK